MMFFKPNCGCCDKDLPPAASDARICLIECTFCADCAENRFDNWRPNCNGNFVQCPVRPVEKLGKYPALAKRLTKAHAVCAKFHN
ncbi:MAG: DUF1272 domain-containing protein [Pseudomonadota bacterium]